LSLGFLVPGGPLVARIGTHLPESLTRSAVWNLVLLPYQAWTTLGIVLFLLAAMLHDQPRSMAGKPLTMQPEVAAIR
ncbi:MAG: hypothetical protein AB7O65_13260, partial [Candidatus Korobacteraceae bacterium]